MSTKPTNYNEYFNDLGEAWNTYMSNLETAIQKMQKDIEEAKGMQDVCTSEWCNVTEHAIDELHNAVYSIHEPKFLEKDCTDRIKDLRKKVKQLYVEFSK